MASISDFNRKVIDEFRANEGRVGGPFEGAPVLLLTSTGAESGEPRTTPEVEATVTDGAERERLFSKQKELFPQFAEYEQKTTRQIPVVALTPKR